MYINFMLHKSKLFLLLLFLFYIKKKFLFNYYIDFMIQINVIFYQIIGIVIVFLYVNFISSLFVFKIKTKIYNFSICETYFRTNVEHFLLVVAALLYF